MFSMTFYSSGQLTSANDNTDSLTRSLDTVEWPHNLRLLRSESFQSEHVQTAAAVGRGGDPALEKKILSYSLMCIQNMRVNKRQRPA